MSFLGRLFLGRGTFRPALRAELEGEGLVLIEEGVPGKIRYTRFKAPGKRFHGKVNPLRLAVAVTEARFVVYSHSGRAELIDSPYSSPHWQMVDFTAADDRLVIRIDYDRADQPKISGLITIEGETPQAALFIEQVLDRLGRAPAQR